MKLYNCLFLSSFLLLHFSWVQIFSSASCFQKSSVYVSAVQSLYILGRIWLMAVRRRRRVAIATTTIIIMSRIRRLYKTGFGLTTGFIGSQVSYTQSNILQLQLTLTTESQLLLSLSRAQDLLQTQLALTGHQLTLLDSRLNWLLQLWLYSLGTDRREDTFLERIPKKHPLAVTK
jgi:hypothetical protein